MRKNRIRTNLKQLKSELWSPGVVYSSTSAATLKTIPCDLLFWHRSLNEENNIQSQASGLESQKHELLAMMLYFQLLQMRKKEAKTIFNTKHLQ